MTDLGELYFDVRGPKSPLMLDYVSVITYPQPPNCSPQTRRLVEEMWPPFKHAKDRLEKISNQFDVFRFTSTDPECTVYANHIKIKVGTGTFMMLRALTWYLDYTIEHKGDFTVEFYCFPTEVLDALDLVSDINFHLPLSSGNEIYTSRGSKWCIFEQRDQPTRAELIIPCQSPYSKEELLEKVENLIRNGILTRTLPL
jgi:hypothetical protein